MNILITGAKGFVGKNLVCALENVKDGKDKTHPELEIGEIFCYDVDTEKQLLDEYCAKADFVFNLAGVNRPKEQSEFMKGNFGFASTLLDTLKKYENKCPVMISSSTQALLDNPYGHSKKAGEDLLFAYAAETGAKVNLKDIKKSDIGEVYKVSVTLFPETLSNGKIPAETTPVEKILNADYNEGLKGTFDGLEDAFKDSPGMADYMGMEMAIVTDCRVDYYFTADSFEPVCARYYVVMNMKNTTNVYINDDGEKQSTPTVSIAINADPVQDSYYFFNDHFNVK